MVGYSTDHVDSDDMSEILQMSRAEYRSVHPSSASGSILPEPLHLRRHALNEQIAEIEGEIGAYDQEIKDLEILRDSRAVERNNLMKELRQLQSGGKTKKGNGKGKQEGIDYAQDNFDWTHELKLRMKTVFGIDNFRLCQQGVCNANMDARDIVCVMPTGGGKSLTYQLPALLTPGCTLVISPLISLITDQILHLREAGVEAVMLTGGTPKETSREIFASLSSLAGRKGASGVNKDIKLCYVTPEKIGRNKGFLVLLEKLATAGKLARIVVDEAHCVSQLGHDFRPDYGKLSVLRQIFPRVPIMALSATCPPKVLQDLITILRLKAITDGSCAKTEGTVYFSAPLYRKNLHYTVLPKPASANKVIQIMVEYILDRFPNETGIVYCLSKKDAENVASGLNSESGGKIKTGVYHADVGDRNKEILHTQWRKGAIKVVCATIAFGLGIDKADVRFVLHHSISKSMDGFYQESGRAGRDGKDSDCVLYYRPQDATRLSTMICGELHGQQKLHDMLRFAQELQECRKVQFARYFSASSQLSMSSWTTDDSDALARCGHCDNCTRSPENVDHRDMTVEAWRILKVADAVNRSSGRATLTKLGDLARGIGGGALEGAGAGYKRKGKEKEKKLDVDVEAIADGKVGLNKEDTETLLVQLLTSQYLTESFHPNPYSVNVYIVPGPQAPRFTRLSRENVEDGKASKIMCSFRRKMKSNRKAVVKKVPLGLVDGRKIGSRATEGLESHFEKQMERGSSEDEEDGAGDGDNERGDGEDHDQDNSFFDLRNVRRSWEVPTKRTRHTEPEISDDSDHDEDTNHTWTYSMRSAPSTHKKARKSKIGHGSSDKTVMEGDIEIMVLSSD